MAPSKVDRWLVALPGFLTEGKYGFFRSACLNLRMHRRRNPNFRSRLIGGGKFRAPGEQIDSALLGQLLAHGGLALLCATTRTRSPFHHWEMRNDSIGQH